MNRANQHRACVGWCAILAAAGGILAVGCQAQRAADRAGQTVPVDRTGISGADWEAALDQNTRAMIDEGRQTFRHDTFGSEAFWGDQVSLHAAIQGEALGGVGPGIGPRQALALGLKVDAAALPPETARAIRAGTADLDSPATTVALLKAGAVVGVTGFFAKGEDRLSSIGVQCALCHSTVDDSLAPGIGRRLDGWPNRDLDIGAIIASAPDLSAFSSMLQVSDAEVRRTLRAWGPGKYDASLNLDGRGFRPDGETAAVLIPPAYGMAGVNNHTWAGERGTVSYWNAYVAVTQMHGKGTFIDARLDDPRRYPVAARTGQGDIREADDRVSRKLPALHLYQVALPVPKAPAGAFNAEAAARGKRLFNSAARCAECHIPPTFSEPGWNLHEASEIGIDDFQASRTPGGQYRTTPLRALWDTDKAHKGGFYHDGRFKTLREVVDHYQRTLGLTITEEQKGDLIQYLRSI